MQRYLNQILNKSNNFSAYFAGGTLCADLNNSVVMINVHGGEFSWVKGATRKLSPVELYLVAKIYTIAKDNGCAFFKLSNDIVTEYESTKTISSKYYAR